MGTFCRLCTVPRFAQCHVGDAILVSESKFQRAVLIKLAAVEPEVSLECL
jgi:hypothetical protein